MIFKFTRIPFVSICIILLFVLIASANETNRVSVDSMGNQGNGESEYPSMSADGRYVAFESYSSNLVPGDTNANWDVFVHDRQTGQTTRVSVDSGGNQGNNPSWYSSISADGRYVAFVSLAANLVSGDTNQADDVFVHDRQTGQTTRVSVDSGGIQGNDASYYPSIGADGRYVAFESFSSNLVPGDTNANWDVFVHDRQTRQTTRVSVDSGGNQGNDASYYSSISADGRLVAFGSLAPDLVSGDTNANWDVFVYENGFFDVSSSHWAYQYIIEIFQMNITAGCSQDPLMYCPDENVSREEMAVFITRGLNEVPPDGYCGTTNPFSDVGFDRWSCKYVKRLVELGITSGIGNGLFGPEDTVTREQMAVFVTRALGEVPVDGYCGTEDPFTDVAYNWWSCKYVKRLMELGITTGIGDGLYGPGNPVTRAQMAVFLSRAFLGM